MPRSWRGSVIAVSPVGNSSHAVKSGSLVGGGVGDGLRRDRHRVADRAHHRGGDRQLLGRRIQAVHPHDVGAGLGESHRAGSRVVALVGRRGQGLERHRDHDRHAGPLRALHEQQGFAEVGEGLADEEVGRPGVDLILELAVEHRPHVVGALLVAGLVGPGERQVARDERAGLAGDLARDAHGVAVDLVDAAGEPDRGELVVARVEGHGLQHLGPRPQELAMQLLQRLGVLDHHLGRERARLHVAALLQLQQIAAVAQHGSVGDAFQDAVGHGCPPRGSLRPVIDGRLGLTLAGHRPTPRPRRPCGS